MVPGPCTVLMMGCAAARSERQGAAKHTGNRLSDAKRFATANVKVKRLIFPSRLFATRTIVSAARRGTRGRPDQGASRPLSVHLRPQECHSVTKIVKFGGRRFGVLGR